jgi:hypothetical protein
VAESEFSALVKNVDNEDENDYAGAEDDEEDWEVMPLVGRGKGQQGGRLSRILFNVESN